jgi:tape measure domain-containing protein
MSYSISLNINHDQLEALNTSIAEGLENFAIAANRLDIVSKKVKENTSFEKESKLIKESLVKLSQELTTSTAKGLQEFTIGINNLSGKISTLATQLHVVDPAEVNGAVSSITSSLTLIKTNLAAAVKGLDINLEGITVAKIGLDKAEGKVELVDIKLVNVKSANGEVELALIETVNVKSAPGEVKKVTVEEVNVKVDSVKPSLTKTTTATAPGVSTNISLAKATPIPVQPIVPKQQIQTVSNPTQAAPTAIVDTNKLVTDLNNAGHAIADSLNQINKQILSSSSAILDAIGDFLHSLKPSGTISSADIVSGLDFATIDLTEIITNKIDLSGLGDSILGKVSPADLKKFIPQDETEKIQATGIESQLQEFARYLEDATKGLDTVNSEFITSATTLTRLTKRFGVILSSTEGFESLAGQIKSQTAQLGEALAGLVIGVRQAQTPGKKVTPASAEDVLKYFTGQASIAKSNGDGGTQQLLQLQGSVLQAQKLASDKAGKPVSLTEANQGGVLNDKLLLLARFGLDSASRFKENNGYGGDIKASELVSFIVTAIKAVRLDKNTTPEQKIELSSLNRLANEKLDMKMSGTNTLPVSESFLANKVQGQVDKNSPLSNLNPAEPGIYSLPGLDIEANAFDRAKKAVDEGASQLDEGLRITLAGLFGYTVEAVQNSKKQAQKTLADAAKKANQNKKDREDKQRELDLQEQLRIEAEEQALATRNQESKANKDRKAAERKGRQANAIAKEQEGTTVALPPNYGQTPSQPPSPPNIPPTPPQPPSNPPKNTNNPPEPNNELTYAQQLRIAKNDFTQSPSLETINQFPDPNEFTWEDQRNLTVALSDMGATRHQNLLSLLSKLKTLETRALSRGKSGETDAIKISQEIKTVSTEVGKAGDNLYVESTNRVDKKIDKNTVDKQKKLAKETISKLETDVNNGAKYQNLLETIRLNSEELGEEITSVKDALDKQIKTRLDKLIKTQLKTISDMMEMGNELSSAGIKFDGEELSNVRHVNGSEYNQEYQDYAQDKLTKGLNKSKREVVNTNTDKANLNNLEGKDYQEQIGNISFIDPVAGKALSDKIEAAKVAKANRTIQEKKDELASLIEINRFDTASRALAALKDSGELKGVEYTKELNNLNEKAISYYRKQYHIAKNAGETVKQNAALLEVEKINPDIATGLKSKETAGISLASKISRANEVIKLGGREEELSQLLEEIKAIDQLKRDVLDSAILAKKRKQIKRDVKGSVARGDGLDQEQLSELDSQTQEEITLSTRGTRINQKKITLNDLLTKLPTDLTQLPAIKTAIAEIKAIDSELAKPIEFKANQEIIGVLYSQLVTAFDSNNTALQNQIELLIVEFDSTASGKAKAQSDSNKIKLLLSQLQVAKQNLDVGLIDSTLLAIKSISNPAFLAASASSRTGKLKALNNNLEKALIDNNEKVARSIAASIQAISPVEGKKAFGKIYKDVNKKSFDSAKDVFNNLKENVITNGIEQYRGQTVSKDVIFGNSKIIGVDANRQANQLVESVNSWLQKQIKSFDTAQLNDAKDLAKLGDFSKLRELKERATTPDANGDLNPVSNQNKVLLAYKQLAETEEKIIQGLSSQQKSVRERLNAQMLAAITDTTEERTELINEALKAIKDYRKENKTAAEADNKTVAAGGKSTYKDQVPNKGLMDNVLQAITNRGENGLKKGAVGENPFKLQDLAGLYYTIYNLSKNIKEFAQNVITSATAVSTELIRLGVVNSGNTAKTLADTKAAQELGKKYGGSQASYLNSIASFKTADILQYDKFGQSQGNRFGQKEVSGLVEGLNAAYSVNQLSKARRDDANAAVTQIFSKGVVNSEEIKRQLSNQIPGAVPLFAQSLGISSGQFTKRLERNEVADTELFRFSSLLKTLFSDAASSVNLNNEVFKLGGKSEDFATSATQPIGATVLPATMLLNKIMDGLVANGAAFTMGMAPVALLLSNSLYGALKVSMATSQLRGIGDGFTSGIKQNALGLGSIGVGLGLATLGSSVLGTAGLDKTLSSFGNNLTLAGKLALDGAGNVWNSILGIFGRKNEISKDAKDDPFAKAAFEIAPLAAMLFPVLNYARGAGQIESRFLGGVGSSKIKTDAYTPQLPEEMRPKPTLLGRASDGIKSGFSAVGSALSTINPVDLGLSIVGAVAAYAIANTNFINEYTKVTEGLIKKLSKIDPNDKSEEAGQVKINELKKYEKAGELTIDSPGQFLRDGYANITGDFSGASTDFVESIAKNSLEKDGFQRTPEKIAEAKKVLETRKTDSYMQTRGVAGTSNMATLNGFNEFELELKTKNKQLLNNGNYKEEFDLAVAKRKQIAIEKEKLNSITKTGLVEDKTGKREVNGEDYDEQATIVKDLEAKYRQTVTKTPKRVGEITNQIAQAESGIENIKAVPFLNDSQKGLRIKPLQDEINALKEALPEIRKQATLIDPTQAASEIVQVNEEKLLISQRQQLRDKAETSQALADSGKQRFYEGSDRFKVTRDADIATNQSKIEYKSAFERATMASENAKATGEQPENDLQKARLKTALMEEATALEQLKTATLNLTQAQLDQQQKLEDRLMKQFDRDMKNYGYGGYGDANYSSKLTGNQLGLTNSSIANGNTPVSAANVAEANKLGMTSQMIQVGSNQIELRQFPKDPKISQEQYDKNLAKSIEDYYTGANRAFLGTQSKPKYSEEQVARMKKYDGQDYTEKFKNQPEKTQTIQIEGQINKDFTSVKTASSQTKNPDSPIYKNNNSLVDIISFGTIERAIYAVKRFQINLPQLALSAAEASDKFRELRTNMVTATLNFANQQRELQANKAIANNLQLPESESVSTFADSFGQLQTNQQNLAIGKKQNQLEITDTKKALSFTDISPEERANLSVKLMTLETDAIRKKHEYEMSGIEMTKAAYQNMNEQLQTKIGEITGRMDNKLGGVNFKLDKQLQETNNQFTSTGGEITSGLKISNELNTAKTKLVESKAERSARNSEVITNATTAINADTGATSLPEGSLGALNALSKLDGRALVDLVNQLDADFSKYTQNKDTLVAPRKLEGIEFPVTSFQEISKVLKFISGNNLANSADTKNVRDKEIELNRYNAGKQREINDSKRNQEANKKDNNRQLELNEKTETNNVDEAQSLINAFIARRDKTPESSLDKIKTVTNKFDQSILVSNQQIKKAEEKVIELKQKNKDDISGGLSKDYEANSEKIKELEDAVRAAKTSQRPIIQQAGMELINTILSLPTTTANLLASISDKIRETADQINNSQSIFDRIGLSQSLPTSKIAESIPEIYKKQVVTVDPITKEKTTKEVDAVRNRLAVENFDSQKDGDREQARLRMDILKHNASVDASIVGLSNLKGQNGAFNSQADLENNNIFKAQTTAIKTRLLSALEEAGGILTPEKANEIVDSLIQQTKDTHIIGEANTALGIQLKKQSDNKVALSTNQNALDENQSIQKSLNFGIERSSYDSKNKIDDKIVEERRLKREKLKRELEYETEIRPDRTDSTMATAKSKFTIGNREIDDQSEKMAEYGGRFTGKIEEAVLSASNLSQILRDSIEKGDWRYALGDILGNIVKSLADSFGKDATENLAGMAKGLFNGILGVTPSKSAGDFSGLPSYSSGALGRMGSEYPRTAIQDGREPRQSHLAVINKDELILNHEQTNDYLNHRTANRAVANVRPSYISNTKTSQDTYQTTNYSTIQYQTDTFGRNSGITGGERMREERRLGS